MPATVLDGEIYFIGEAARLLRVSTARLRAWIDGYSRAGRSYPPIIRPEPTGNEALTWGEFVEAGFLREYPARPGLSLLRLRPVVQMLRDRLGVPYPLALAKPYLARRDLVLDIQKEVRLGQELALVVSSSGELVLTPRAAAFVAKVEFAPVAGCIGGAAVRLFPRGPTSPVAIDPMRSFGAPAVNGVRTEVLYTLFTAGNSVATLVHAYRLPAADVEAAIRFEATARAQQNSP